uniref:Protein kinase domain-containing protein n=1 Tax=Electrophorus electricus TaxID=8005 RepID=A0A4W4FCD3_ELEEL
MSLMVLHNTQIPVGLKVKEAEHKNNTERSLICLTHKVTSLMKSYCRIVYIRIHFICTQYTIPRQQHMFASDLLFQEVVRSEIEVMNQLNHANLIQLYAAYESRYDITLIMEYVEGGELFDRIIDENYKLTELDTVLFIRQITEGLEYMHKMYILHLDLKPENILCVSRETNKIKIIDFGLARRYKPREKLRVNFGTPEFLAPEVINYEFVSFPTDMWSLGVITYMLLSGLSPFLGDDDNETLNNILACQWTFEGAEFSDISDEAKDFIQRLLVKSKSWRMSASQSLKHPWLSNPSLHYRLHQKVSDISLPLAIPSLSPSSSFSFSLFLLFLLICICVNVNLFVWPQKNKCHSRHAPPPES